VGLDDFTRSSSQRRARVITTIGSALISRG
jgi:hypothetical protein